MDKTADAIDKILNPLYYNIKSSVSFGNQNTLYNAARKHGITRTDVKNWLSSQPVHTLHKQARKKFPRRKVHATGENKIWQCDLADFAMLKSSNNNYKYILCCIDVFSRKAYVEPLKNKNGTTVKNAFVKIFDTRAQPLSISTDLGTEFFNSIVSKLFKSKNIDHFTTHSEIKMALCERFIRTLRLKIYKYLTANLTHRYINVLQQIVENYNNTKHSSIGMSPNQVKKSSIELVWHRSWNKRRSALPDIKPKLKVGELVRISKYKKPFMKGALPNFSDEIFTVHAIQSISPPTYILRDSKNNILEGVFYQYELQAVKEPDLYRIEKIIKKRKTSVLVRWQGYSSEYDTWIPKRMLRKQYGYIKAR